MYGRGAQSLADQLHVSEDEAQETIDGWLRTYPGAARYLHMCEEAVDNGSFIETPYGRRRRFGLVSKQSKHSLHNEAKNFAIQSVSSDNTLLTAMRVYNDLIAKYDARIVNFIHDSILIECPYDLETVTAISKWVSEELVQQTVTALNTKVPFTTDTDIGLNWGEVSAFDHNNGTVKVKRNGEKVKIPYDEWLKEELDKHVNYDAIKTYKNPYEFVG